MHHATPAMRLRCPLCRPPLPLPPNAQPLPAPQRLPLPLAHVAAASFCCFTCGVTHGSKFSDTQAAQVGGHRVCASGVLGSASPVFCRFRARARDVALREQACKCKKRIEEAVQRRWQPSFAFASPPPPSPPLLQRRGQEEVTRASARRAAAAACSICSPSTVAPLSNPHAPSTAAINGARALSCPPATSLGGEGGLRGKPPGPMAAPTTPALR